MYLYRNAISAISALGKLTNLQDEIGGVPIVLIASPRSDFVRVYERKTYQFEGSGERVVEIDTMAVWRISEESLSHPESRNSLKRLPEAFVSFWFAWFSFYPDTLFYKASLNVDPNTHHITKWGAIKR